MNYSTLIFLLFLTLGSASFKDFMKKEVNKKLEKLASLIPPMPWVSQEYKEKLPKTVSFHLYTRSNVNVSEVFEVDVTKKDSLFDNFKRERKTKILIPGWMGHHKATVCTLLKSTYLEVDDYNIVVFDWAKEAKKFYAPAREAVPEMGRIVADFIDALVSRYNLKTSDLHLIGHSLGAHVSGIAGSLMKSGKLGRITGLDPALPLFQGTPENLKLSRVSADFVDVIHTCGLFLGIWSDIGHADFYPNKGTFIQPGCGADLLGKCSHRRAYYYFSESIKEPNKFISTKCNSWESFSKKECGLENIPMGESCPISARGSFFLLTSQQAPFGRGLDSIKIDDSYHDNIDSPEHFK